MPVLSKMHYVLANPQLAEALTKRQTIRLARLGYTDIGGDVRYLNLSRSEKRSSKFARSPAGLDHSRSLLIRHDQLNAKARRLLRRVSRGRLPKERATHLMFKPLSEEAIWSSDDFLNSPCFKSLSTMHK